MATLPDLATPTDLVRTDTVSVADALNSILADVFALYLKTKNFHWHMTGPHFRDYHLLLDDQATQIFEITDAVAERVRKIGCVTLRSIGEISRRQRIPDSDGEALSARDMLRELREDNYILINHLREAKALVDDVGDNATSGLIDTWTDEAEERAWFLFEATRSG
jgi:starvation-inducible DNA-binding protein